MAIKVPTDGKMDDLRSRYWALPLGDKDLVMHHMIGKNRARVWIGEPPDFWQDFKQALDYVESLIKRSLVSKGDSETT